MEYEEYIFPLHSGFSKQREEYFTVGIRTEKLMTEEGNDKSAYEEFSIFE